MDLGEHLTKLDDGAVFATVFPLAGSAAPSAQKVRELLADWFHIEYVIWSHDPQRPWFSENTSISEMLIVARRHPADPEERPPTRFVCLRRNSYAATDAVGTVLAIRDEQLDPSVGSVSEWPAARMLKGEWRPLGFNSPRLVADYERMATGQQFAKLGEIATFGPDGRGIRDAFTQHDVPDATGRRALWRNNPTTDQQFAKLGEIATLGPAGQGFRDTFTHTMSPMPLADAHCGETIPPIRNAP